MSDAPFTLVTTDAAPRTVPPNVGLVRSEDHHYRYADGPWLPGVTSVIEKLDKGHRLKRWNRGVVADAALDNLGRLTAMVAESGRGPAKAWLTGQAELITDAAKDLGTKVHTLAELRTRGYDLDIPPEQVPYVDAYDRFRTDWAPRFMSLEHYVVNLTAGYGGTFDWIAEIGGDVGLGDTKSGKGHYVESRLQLSALTHAEFLGLPHDPTRYPLPTFQRAWILHLRPGTYELGYQLYRVDLTPRDFDAFLGALAIYRWAEQHPTKGEPIPAPDALLNQLEASLSAVT